MRYYMNAERTTAQEALAVITERAEIAGWDREEVEGLWGVHLTSEEARDILTGISDCEIEFIAD